VELNNGLVAGLYVPKDDCAPLAGLMQTLIRCHRPPAPSPRVRRLAEVRRRIAQVGARFRSSLD